VIDSGLVANSLRIGFRQDGPVAKAKWISAGIVLYRRPGAAVGSGDGPEPGPSSYEVLLAHPGGPFFASKDVGAWSIPKGLYEPGVDRNELAAAVREFTEEIGSTPPAGPYAELGSVTLASGKVVTAWAVEGDLDPATATSSTFELEWPRRSAQRLSFPEVDRVEWFSLAAARPKINQGQLPLLDRLAAALT
jgi:predicted NUDIX family NTP pyrophosphohydrolase